MYVKSYLNGGFQNKVYHSGTTYSFKWVLDTLMMLKSLVCQIGKNINPTKIEQLTFRKSRNLVRQQSLFSFCIGVFVFACKKRAISSLLVNSVFVS